MKWVLSTLLLIFSLLDAKGQLLDTVFDLNLKAIPVDDLKNKDFIILSNRACYSCVNYVIESEYTENILVVIDQFSLAEVLALMDLYTLNNEKVFFIVTNDFSLLEKSPSILKHNTILIRYSAIEKLSGNFNLSKKKFLSKIMEYNE